MAGSNVVDVAMGTTAGYFGSACGTVVMLLFIAVIAIFGLPIFCCLSTFIVMAGVN